MVLPQLQSKYSSLEELFFQQEGTSSYLACLHDQNKMEGRLFSSQSELFEHFSDCSDWLDKSRPSKKATFVLIM